MRQLTEEEIEFGDKCNDLTEQILLDTKESNSRVWIAVLSMGLVNIALMNKESEYVMKEILKEVWKTFKLCQQEEA